LAASTILVMELESSILEVILAQYYCLLPDSSSLLRITTHFVLSLPIESSVVYASSKTSYSPELPVPYLILEI
jgi:hypothetical protein